MSTRKRKLEQRRRLENMRRRHLGVMAICWWLQWVIWEYERTGYRLPRNEVERKVLKNSRWCRKHFAELLNAYDGRTVIVLDEEVQGNFPDDEAAYAWAVRTLGLYSGFCLFSVHPGALDPIWV